jgi:beta-lactamase superfamily II metal-dependent hydrolase
MRRAHWLLTVSVLGPLLGTGPVQASSHEEQFTMVQVAVRQGDAAVFRGPCGELGVVDTNAHRSEEVLAVLDQFGTRELEWIAVSHYDSDHLGGILDVATAPGASVETVYDRGGGQDERETGTYQDYFDWATSDATTRQSLDIGDSFSLCATDQEVVFEVVSSGTDGTVAAGVSVTEENDKGLCLKVTFHMFLAAMCGDVNGTSEGERADVESAVAPAIGKVHLAKINHHGSRFSSNEAYVDTLAPAVAVVSTGKNSFGHPDEDVLARWREHGDVYVTQDSDNEPIDGNVTASTEGNSFFTITSSGSGVTKSYSLDPAARCPGFEDVPGNHIVGTADDDVIAGSDGPDVLCGLGGDDELLGFADDDTLIGGTADDAIDGGSGDDELTGSDGADALNGGAGIDACDVETGEPSALLCDTQPAGAEPVQAPPPVQVFEREEDGMFGSGILDVTIGLILLYLVLSLVASAVNEAIAALLRSRARFLREGISSLLGGRLTDAFYGHPLLRSLKKGDRNPSYLPPRTFALVLLDLVVPQALGSGKDGDEPPSQAQLRRAIDRAEFEEVKEPLKLLLRESRADLERLRENVVTWFNDVMDRVSGWYKRHTQIVLAIIAFTIVVVANADTVQIARALWNSESLRQAVVAEAQSRVAQEPVSIRETEEQGVATTASPGDGVQEELEEVAREVDTLSRLQLPLGWSLQPGDPRWISGQGFVAVAAAWIVKIFGLLLTIAAITVGAPFWFDLLKRIVGIRSSGPPPEERPSHRAGSS